MFRASLHFHWATKGKEIETKLLPLAVNDDRAWFNVAALAMYINTMQYCIALSAAHELARQIFSIYM